MRNSEGSMRFEFEAGPEMYYRASREMAKTTWRGRVSMMTPWITPLILCAFGVSLLLLGNQIAWGVLTASLLILGFAVAMPFLQKRAIARNLRSNPSAAGPVKYEIDPHGITVTTAGTVTQIPWSNLTRVRLSTEFVLLMTSPVFGYFIPTQVLTDGDLRQIVTWAKPSASPM